MLRGLVGLAALAVVAFVGYFFWQEYAANREAQRVADISDRRAECLALLQDYADAGGSGAVSRTDLDPCVNGLLITTQDIEAARRR